MSTLLLYPIVFNMLSEPIAGMFQERIRSSAVDRTLREKTDVAALAHHNVALVLGRTSSRTLSLTKEARFLRAELTMPRATYAEDLAEGVRRGDVRGGSFTFRALEDEWSFDGTLPIRDVIDMEVFEVSVVTFPAYLQTSVAIRSALRSPQRPRQVPAAPPRRPGRSLALAKMQQRQAMAELRDRRDDLERTILRDETGRVVTRPSQVDDVRAFADACQAKFGTRTPPRGWVWHRRFDHRGQKLSAAWEPRG
jgi:HK97 family phage prohead protease